MKKLVLTLAGIALATSLFAQGQLNFVTAGTTTTIFDVNGTTALSGSSFAADLYYGSVGANPSTFVSAGLNVPFQSGALAGKVFQAGAVTIPGHAADTQVDVQLRAWSTVGGVTSWAAAVAAGNNASPVTAPTLTIMLKGPPATPLNLSGLGNSSLVAVPEPATMLLGLAGIGGLVFLRRKMAK